MDVKISQTPSDRIDSGQGFRIESKNGPRSLGRQITTGDINGDGFDDIVITANGDFYDNNNSPDGHIFVVFGGTNFTAVSLNETPEVPLNAELKQNYPNPFNPATTIEFNLGRSGDINLSVVDVLGRTVDVLADGPHSAGTHRLSFNGAHLASGVYLYQLWLDGELIEQRKMALLK